jgi:hypothetical protein
MVKRARREEEEEPVVVAAKKTAQRKEADPEKVFALELLARGTKEKLDENCWFLRWRWAIWFDFGERACLCGQCADTADTITVTRETLWWVVNNINVSLSLYRYESGPDDPLEAVKFPNPSVCPSVFRELDGKQLPVVDISARPPWEEKERDRYLAALPDDPPPFAHGDVAQVCKGDLKGLKVQVVGEVRDCDLVGILPGERPVFSHSCRVQVYPRSKHPEINQDLLEFQRNELERV